VIEIDGSERSGSGTIVRLAVALSALTGQALRMLNARARRRSPGLRPQHVASVQACAALCGAATPGLVVGARTFEFVPGNTPVGGAFQWDIGTAGSATMLALSLLPIAAFADGPVRARIIGGVFQDFAPSPFHLSHVLSPTLRRMGVRFGLEVERPGYVPHGAGILSLTAEPVAERISPLSLVERGPIERVDGVALASLLAERRVSERMAVACERRLASADIACRIERIEDTGASHPGASLAVWAQSAVGCALGADQAGAYRRSSESIGRAVAEMLIEDLASSATVDRHAADMLVVFAALASGSTCYIAPRVTEHLETNLWLVERFGARTRLTGTEVRIDGIGFHRGARVR